MSKDELLSELKECHAWRDEAGEWVSGKYNTGTLNEGGHATADALLLQYIDDEDITAAFDRIERYYSY
jgi:hypothetical protein